MLNIESKGDVESLSYTDFIALIQEENRCPGGKKTIHEIAKNTFLNKESHVLEVGSNNGFTSLELARLTKCEVTGIDINQKLVEVANKRLEMEIPEVRQGISFQVGSAYDIPFEDNMFDLVVAGGATSFMDDKIRALTEYHRVLKPWGFLSVTNLFYHTEPPQKVVNDVSTVIGCEIKPWDFHQWVNLYKGQSLFEEYSTSKFKLNARPEQVVQDYVVSFMKKENVASLDGDVQIALLNRWKSILDVFNKNHEYLGFILSIFRKRNEEEEPELFSDIVALD